jgi:conjugal transfer pilus assembly protein TraA
MRITNKIKAMGTALMLSAISSPVFAGGGGTGTATDGAEFKVFQDTVIGWTQGPLGIGLAVTMLLMGGAIGVSKNSPMPALSGIAGAAFLNYGPDIIVSIMGDGGMF